MGEPAAKRARTNGVELAAKCAQIKRTRLMTAIKTPYGPDGGIDYAAYDKHVEHQINNGVEALIVGGTTGEGHLMGWEEHLCLIAHTKAKFKDRILVVGNTGSNHTAESISATRKGFNVGMDCSLLINPYYGKTSKRGIIKHIEAGMDFGPAIIYNVPGRTGQDIPPETIYELAKHKYFAGVKECMGNARIKELSDKGIACWSGNDDEAYEARHNFGAMGVISVTSNVVPKLFSELMTKKNDALNEKLKPLYKWLFTEPNPIGVNTMMMMLGNAEPIFRLPYVERSKDARVEGKAIIEKVGVEHFPFLGKATSVRVLEDADFVHALGEE